MCQVTHRYEMHRRLNLVAANSHHWVPLRQVPSPPFKVAMKSRREAVKHR